MKRFLNFIIGKLFRVPPVNLDNTYPPVIYGEISANVETLRARITIDPLDRDRELESHKREIAWLLAEELIPFIDFEVVEGLDGVYDPYRCKTYHSRTIYGTLKVIRER